MPDTVLDRDVVLTDWEARRSGARITITGRDGAGRTVKVSVDAIKRAGTPPDPLRVVAFGADDQFYVLA